MRQNDHLLAERFICGDPTAFDQIVTAHQRRVATLAGRLLGWPDQVDDVVQDVFLAVLKNLKNFKGQSDFSTWITRITINQCRTYQRKHFVRLNLLRGLLQENRPPAPPTADPLTQAETCQTVRLAIRKLPIRLREVVALHYLEEMPINRIATILGLSRNAIEVRLHRARKRLKTTLAEFVEI